MRPIVSVLLPTRDRHRLLKRSMDSVQKQTLPEIEILVLDDGSSDETPLLLEGLARRDTRIRWFRRDFSRGLAEALNTLIAESHGEYLARMDDDDLCHPRRFELQLEWMQANRVDVCGTWYRRCSALGKSAARPPVQDSLIKAELLFQPPLLHPSVMLRRELVERHGSYAADFPHAEDYELWVRLAPYVRFGNVPQLLMDYMLSRHQVSKRHNTEQVMAARRIREKYLRTLGICCGEEERRIHCHLRDPAPIDSMDTLDRIDQWLRALEMQLPGEARPVLCRQWFLAAVRAAGMGPCVFRKFAGSPLSHDVPRSKWGMLKAMCAIHFRYRSLIYNWLEPLAPAG
ncbi:glycosyltransferase family 2 protein [Desulfosoma sp.]